VKVVSPKNNAYFHFLDSATAEIQFQLYARLAPDFTKAMSHTNSLLDRPKSYKEGVGMLGSKTRAADWIWGEISAGGYKWGGGGAGCGYIPGPLSHRAGTKGGVGEGRARSIEGIGASGWQNLWHGWEWE